MHYSVQPRDQIFGKGCKFLSFAKNAGKNTGTKISKNVRGRYNKTLLDQVK